MFNDEGLGAAMQQSYDNDRIKQLQADVKFLAALLTITVPSHNLSLDDSKRLHSIITRGLR